jgi:hypothetical protein
VWELIFLMVILKIPIAYLCWVVWWAVKAEPKPDEEQPVRVLHPYEPMPPTRPRRHGPVRPSRPHAGGPARRYARSRRVAAAYARR